MEGQSALAGLRVVDFSNLRTGAQVSQFLADFGADVVHVERPGSPLRAEAAWPFWGRGKRSVELDLKDAADLAVARRLAQNADVVIETFRPGVADRLGLGYEDLSRTNPKLVYASISGFGSKGPYVNLKGYEGVVMAKLGVFQALTGLARRPGHAFVSAAYCSYPASQLALQGILAALYERMDSGVGQHIETSLVQGITVCDTFNWFARVMATRFSDGYVQAPRAVGGVPSGGMSFRLLIALTKDGKWLQFSQTPARLFRAMMKLFELEWMFDDPKWNSLPDFDDVEQRIEYWEILLGIVRGKTAAEWFDLFTANPDVWGEEFRQGSDLLHHPQMIWNHMVDEHEDRDVGKLRSPAALVRALGTPARVDRPAPRKGEHDAAIRAEAAASPAGVASDAVRTAPTGARPLEGVTVIELGTYYAAPFGATLLAEWGARVIKLEELEGDPHRNMLPFPEIAGLKVLQGKECVAVDLRSDKGREIAHHILSKADVVLQSFRAGVADRLKLDAATLRALNPDLIYFNAPGYGVGGPYGHRPAFAPTIGAAAGLAFRNAGASIPSGADLALDDVKQSAMQLGAAVMGVGNSDGLSAVSVGTGMMLGLLARRRGAGGQEAFTSMLSSTGHALSEVMVEYENRPPVPTADAGIHGFSALYRLYEAANGGWVFLAAPTDREWVRFTGALPGGAALGADPRFAAAEARKANDEALAQELAAVFRTRPSADWEALFTPLDIACVVSSEITVEGNLMDEGSLGVLSDMVTTAHHPILDEVPRLKPLVRFSRSTTVAGDAGLVGQHTVQVLSDYGYSDDDIARLAADGVILLG
jgi:crotonobetainyl-CoA:carnitine CoA-transferase CaiB-like acyl-CoA transferase